MEFLKIAVKKPEELNFILGQSHFIKTVEDIYEAIVCTCPSLKFGIAFCEASGPCLIRYCGNDETLEKLAVENAQNLSCGHSFFIFMEQGFPINILNQIKMVPEVCRIYCATANPTEIIVAETEQGRGIMGVVDGFASKGVETDADIQKRKDFLRMIKYKL